MKKHLLLLIVFTTVTFSSISPQINTTLTGTFNTNGLSNDVYVVNNTAYVSDHNFGLRILNVTNPASPSEIGYFLALSSANVLSSFVINNYAYVVTDNGRLSIINVSSPSGSISETGGYSFTGSCDGVAVSGNYAYVTNNVNGLQVLNITDPANPTYVGNAATGVSNSVVISGNYAYVSTDDRGLQVVNISNPAAPSIVGSFEYPGHAYGIAVSGNYVYITKEVDQIVTIDISIPSSPRLVNAYSLSTAGITRDIVVNGKYAYIADYDYGLRIFDISDTLNPTEAGYYNTNGLALGVAFSGTAAYIADYDYGLQIINNNLLTLGSLSLTTPNAPGLSLKAGSSYNITWSATSIDFVKLEYSVNNGSNWTTITASTAASAGTYTWTVPNSPSSQCKVKISSTSNASLYDISENNFKIYTLALTSPNGGQTIQVGSNHNITWTSSQISNLKIEYSTDNGSSWNLIIASVAASSGSYNWTPIPNTPSANCLVKITDASNNAINDIGDAVFAIAPQESVTLSVPNGGESWQVGNTYGIKWSSLNVTNVKLEYSTDNGVTWTTIIASTPSSGNYDWIVPNTPSVQCKVRISDASDNNPTDISNSVFSIVIVAQQTVELTSPNGGETWEVGSSHSITWTSANILNVKLEYTTNSGASWNTIIGITPASNASYSWTVPDVSSSTCKVRITDESDGIPEDQSNALFTVIPASQTFSITSPNGGENWSVGSSHNITWSQTNVSSINLEYSTNNGSSWITIINHQTAALNLYSWTIPNTPSANCLVRALDYSTGNVLDQSNSVFTIPSSGKSLSIISPILGDTWEVGSGQWIKWTSTGITSITIQCSTNGGSSWDVFVAGSVSAASDSILWNVPNNQSTNCKIRINDVDNFSIQAISNTFTIFATSKNISYLGKINTPGNAMDVVQNLGYAYVADAGSGLRVIDVSDPTNPVEVGFYDSPGTANALVLKNQYIYLADGTGGLRIIDITNPASPVLTGFYDTNGEAVDILIKSTQDIVYLADGTAGVKIFDVSVPSTPALLSSITSFEANSLDLLSTSLFVSSGEAGIREYSVTNPSSPSLLATLTANLNTGAAHYTTRPNPIHSAAFVSNTRPTYYEMAIIDCSAGGLAWEGWFTVHQKINGISNDYDFDQYRVYTAEGTSGIRMYSVPLVISNTYEAGHYDTDGEAMNLLLKNNIFYVADGSDGLVLLNNDIYTDNTTVGIHFHNTITTAYYGDWQRLDITKGSQVEAVKIEYSSNNGNTWNPVANNVTASYFDWTIPNAISDSCKLRVMNVDNINKNNTTAVFRIIQPVITVTSPNGGETFRAYDTVNVNWVSSGLSQLNLFYSTNSGSSWTSIASNLNPNLGTYQWIIPNINSTNCKIKIENIDYSRTNVQPFDISDAVFTIAPTLYSLLFLDSPVLNTIWYEGEVHNITWDYTNIDNIKIEYSVNNGSVWKTIISSTPAVAKSYAWTVPLDYSLRCKLRISDVLDSNVNDTSYTFQIEEPVTPGQPVYVWNAPGGVGAVLSPTNWDPIRNALLVTDKLIIDGNRTPVAEWTNVPNTAAIHTLKIINNATLTLSSTSDVAVSASHLLRIDEGSSGIVAGPFNISSTFNSGYKFVLNGTYEFDGGTFTNNGINMYGTGTFRTKGETTINSPSSDTMFSSDITFEVYNGNTVLSTNSYNRLVNKGNLTIGSGATLYLGAPLEFQVAKNINNQGAITGGTNSKIKLIGSTDQSVNGIFKSLTVSNPNYINLSGNSQITDLDLTSGKINTGSYTLTLGESASTTGSLAMTTGKIIGKLKRWLAASTGSALYPMGSTSSYCPVNINFTSSPGSGGTVMFEFIPSDPGKFGLPYNDGGTVIDRISPDGYWRGTSGNGLSGGVYSIDITADNFFGISDYTSLRMVKRNIGGLWLSYGTHSPSTGSNSVSVLHRTGLNSFSDFAVGSTPSNPFPVELTSFTAVNNKNTVRLNWETKSEIRSLEFTIERKSANEDWLNAGTVSSHGNSNDVNKYSFTDKSLKSIEYEYRLKMIDVDGNYKYSNLVKVTVEIPTEYLLSQNYPNPFNPSTKINYQLPVDAKVTIELFNIVGEKVCDLVNKEQSAGYYTIDFNAGFASGVYIYRMTASDKIKGNNFVNVKKLMMLK